MGTTTNEFGRLRVFKDVLSEWEKAAKLAGCSVLDVAHQALRPGSTVLSKLKEAGDDYYFKHGKRGFTASYIRARAEELAANLDNTNQNGN